MLEHGELNSSHLPALPFAVKPAASWQRAIDEFRFHEVGCVLVDLDADPDLIAQHCDLRQNWIHLTVVACSHDVSPANVIRAVSAGCIDLVKKPLSLNSLVEAIDRACRIDAAGEFGPSSFRTRVATLTCRELEVLKMFLNGDTTKSIAKQLGVSYQTIDKHRNRALKKMDISNLIELARAVYHSPLLVDWQQCGKHACADAENPHLFRDQNSERNSECCR
ncbi:MAG: response regulator transcription factor [Pirellulaceae bacterium]|nr:response regulator transcription factor [Pirellulaceae bacterium]